MTPRAPDPDETLSTDTAASPLPSPDSPDSPDDHSLQARLGALFSLLQRDRALSPRSRQSTFESSLHELRAEVEELEVAFRQSSNEEIKAELGDVLWVVLFIMILSEEAGRFSASEVLAHAIDKLNRRKPWLGLAGCEAPSLEDEARLWAEANRLERLGG